MTEHEQQSQEPDAPEREAVVEDLDVPEEQAKGIAGGSGVLRGKHIDKADLTC